MTVGLADDFVKYSKLISLKKVVSETLEDFISKMKSKDKKAKTVEMEYKTLAQNGRFHIIGSDARKESAY